jgi:hypothetical protein
MSRIGYVIADRSRPIPKLWLVAGPRFRIDPISRARFWASEAQLLLYLYCTTGNNFEAESHYHTRKCLPENAVHLDSKRGVGED